MRARATSVRFLIALTRRASSVSSFSVCCTLLTGELHRLMPYRRQWHAQADQSSALLSFQGCQGIICKRSIRVRYCIITKYIADAIYMPVIVEQCIKNAS